MAQPVRKAVFPVAGRGTRFLPATKVIPKEMIPIVDKPVIQYAVEEARAAGIEHFIFVISNGKEAIASHFEEHTELEQTLEALGKTAEVSLVRDVTLPHGSLNSVKQEEPLGLGHAVWCARDLVGNQPFAVILPDDMVLSKTPCLKQILDIYADVGGHVVAVEDVSRDKTNKYGILDVTKDMGNLVRARGLVEKPLPENAPSTLAIIGRYVLDPMVFEVLGNHKRGTGDEIQLTDALNSMIQKLPLHGLRFEGLRYDCGSQIGFVEANVAFALAHTEISESIKPLLRKLLNHK
ncbi:MAG: UTP--glucose-1-phosphate uridylyltransferase [Candidatus Marinimicrobia bacterium]|nr:UTP--glucose-1-phosphate uridylyltransferase [Candidatus Neomarinimicrobiota bacterium]